MSHRDHDWNKVTADQIATTQPGITFSAARKLITYPALYTTSVTERVEAGWDELTRHIKMIVEIPPSDGEDDGTENGGSRLFAIPILFPSKARVVDLDGVKDGDGDNLTLLAHNEHHELTRLIVREAMWLSARTLLARRGTGVIPSLLALQEKLDALIECEPSDSARLLSELLADSSFVALGASDERDQLQALATRFSERYPVFAILVAESGETVSVHFTTCNEVYTGGVTPRLDFIRRLFGDKPIELRIPLQRARRTSDYHLYVVSPPGNYCFEQVAMRSPRVNPGITSMTDAILPKMGTSRGRNVSRYAASGGARTTAHLYVADGHLSGTWLDANVRWQELPLGSAGSTLAATVLSLMAALGLYIMALSSAKQEITPTAVIVLLTTALVPATAMFLANKADPSLTSRLISLCLAALGATYAGWWAFLVAPTEKASPAAGAGTATKASAVGTQDAGHTTLVVIGAIFLACYAILACWAALRARKAMSNHRSTVGEG